MNSIVKHKQLILHACHVSCRGQHCFLFLSILISYNCSFLILDKQMFCNLTRDILIIKLICKFIRIKINKKFGRIFYTNLKIIYKYDYKIWKTFFT